MVFHFRHDARYSEVQAIDIPFLSFIREIEIRSPVVQELITEGCLIIFIGIGPKVDPDKGEGVGGVVMVEYFLKAVQGMFSVIQGDVDSIADLLLPSGWRGRGVRGGCLRGSKRNGRRLGRTGWQ